jgi:6-phosphofructokinase 1
VQRGGQASAYDRLLGTRLGSEAVLALMMMAQSMENSHKQQPQPIVIAVNGNKTCYIPLEESVEKTKIVATALAQKDYKKVVELRGSSFQRNLDTYIKMSKLEPKMFISHSHAKMMANYRKSQSRYRLAVLNLGAPASGANSAVRSFVRHAVSVGCTCLCVQDGFEGFVLGYMKPMEWNTVYGWTSIGGSLLGCQRVDAKQVGYAQIAKKIHEFRIDGLALIGGFEAFLSVVFFLYIISNFLHSTTFQF